MTTTLEAVQAGIKTALAERFALVSVASYSTDSDLSVLAPACLLELEEFPMGADAGDGRYSAQCNFAIHCVLAYSLENRTAELIEFAAAIAQLVRSSYWLKGSVTRGEQVEVFPGNFHKDTNGGYESWVVSWQQTVYLGESMWSAEGIAPQQVLIARAENGESAPVDAHEVAINE